MIHRNVCLILRAQLQLNMSLNLVDTVRFSKSLIVHFTSVSKCQSCVIGVNVLPDGWRFRNIDIQLSQAGSFGNK